MCTKVEKLTSVPKNSHPVLIPQNFGNLIHSFISWLKFHTKTCTMTSCQDIGISFMSPVLKKLLPIKKVCSPKLDENTFQEEISAWVKETLTKICAWSSLLKLLCNFLSHHFFFAHWLAIPGSWSMEMWIGFSFHCYVTAHSWAWLSYGVNSRSPELWASYTGAK